MHELRRRNGELQHDLVHTELRRIETLQRKWNALTFAERAMIAKASPDLTLFFQPCRLGAQTTFHSHTWTNPQGVTRSDSAAGAAGPVAG